jgi:hypothetical protein
MASNSKNIAELLNGDVTVTAVDIADDAVTAAKIATGAVVADGLGTGAVTATKLGASAVTTAKINAGAITTAKIAAALDLSATTLTMPAGALLQVVHATNGTDITFSQTHSTYATTISGTITPSATSSKILIMTLNALDACSGGHYPALHGKILRGSTEIDGMELVFYQGNTNNHRVGEVSWNYIDSPNTASAVTYNIQWANSGGSSVSGTYSGVANQYGNSQIFLLEIAG